MNALNTGIYLVEKNKKESQELFIKSVLSGRKGLWMTRSNPMELRSRHGFISTVIIDLNEYSVSSDGKKRFDKSLFELVEQFLNRYKNMVILIEDAEDVMNDSFVEFLELNSLISSAFLSSDIIFILSLDGTYDEMKTKLLKTEYGFIKL